MSGRARGRHPGRDTIESECGCWADVAVCLPERGWGDAVDRPDGRYLDELLKTAGRENNRLESGKSDAGPTFGADRGGRSARQ